MERSRSHALKVLAKSPTRSVHGTRPAGTITFTPEAWHDEAGGYMTGKTVSVSHDGEFTVNLMTDMLGDGGYYTVREMIPGGRTYDISVPTGSGDGPLELDRLIEPERLGPLICDCCKKRTTLADSVPMISTDWRASGALCNECANYGVGEEVN